MNRSEEFYRERAAAAAQDAKGARLANVRDRALRAQAAWLEFADRESRQAIERERIRAEKAERDEARAETLDDEISASENA